MTPSKRKGVRVDPNADEPTELATPKAPWDHGSLTAEVDAVADAPAAEPQEAELAPGTQLGEYVVERKIGEGGMGVVYSATHPLIGKRAAIKVLKAELCRSAFNIERFVDEARIVNQIGHQNIVDIFAFGQTADGRSYFVMEWLKGESLRDRVARSRLDLDEICDVIRPLARALEAAHEQGVIHRDLKPDNIFLVEVRGDVPLVKLLDFGIAKLARVEHRMERTATGAMVGTPQYIAPEQAKGYAIDHRVDIYSLGGIMFELLTGRPPFVADNAMELVAKHLMEQPPRPSAFAVLPPELDDLVVRMLAKDPAGRPSLAEVAAVVERTSALDRTNVKAQAAPPPAGPTSSGPIDIPVPTATSIPRLATPNPALANALAKAMAATPTPAPPTEMTATIRARRPGAGRGILLAVVGMVAVAAITFTIVSMMDDPIGSSTGASSSSDDETPSSEAPSETTATVSGTAATEAPASGSPSSRAEAPSSATRSRSPSTGSPSTSQSQSGTPSTGSPSSQSPTGSPSSQSPTRSPSSQTPTGTPSSKTPTGTPSSGTKSTATTAGANAGTNAGANTNTRTQRSARKGRLELRITGGKDTPRIVIDGKPAGPSTTLAPGKHRVVITSKGMKKQAFTVTIEAGDTVQRTIELEAKAKSLGPGRELMEPDSLGGRR